jgi:hypothetical protein
MLYVYTCLHTCLPKSYVEPPPPGEEKMKISWTAAPALRENLHLWPFLEDLPQIHAGFQFLEARTLTSNVERLTFNE